VERGRREAAPLVRLARDRRPGDFQVAEGGVVLTTGLPSVPITLEFSEAKA
jgi:hypothetical protein